MTIFGVFTMIGGLALFLYGMNVMGDSLSKLSGGKLEGLLERLTSHPLKAVILGAGVTAVIQSSSATTVMVVGFVNSGIMQLGHAAGVIMGANVGTTITSWLLSLTGISGANIFVKMLKPSSFSPILAGIGIICMMTAKNNEKKKDIGSILLGFAILMFGMETMSGAVAPLADNPAFTKMFTMFSNPILGMIAGAVLTAVIQSSSASVGILQALCASGAVSYGAAIPIIMGQNIGTCVTAMISSVGASKNARRASMIHLYFNLIGTALFMVVFYSIHKIVGFAFVDTAVHPMGIAVIHSLFNIGCVIVLFPFMKWLVKLATWSVKENSKDQEALFSVPPELQALDERFLEQPAFAMELCKNAVYAMADRAHKCILLAVGLIQEYNEEDAGKLRELEHSLDRYEDVLGSYLVKLSSRNLSLRDSQVLSVILHCSSDLERISDLCLNILGSVEEMRKNDQSFTTDALRELMVILQAVSDIVGLTTGCFVREDLEGAKQVEPLEEVIDDLNVTLRQSHIKRLRQGRCTIEMGIILEDIITDLERISDHCSNIAVCMIEVNEDAFETHEYIAKNLKKTQSFSDEVDRLKLIYKIDRKKD